MSIQRALETTKVMRRKGGPMDFGSDNLRLLVRVVHALAGGRPVSRTQVEGAVRDLGIDGKQSERFLRQVTERDDSGDIVGALGLSLRQHPHRFLVNGARMTAWCAQDTMFLPVILQRTATVESDCPVSGETIRLAVGPDGVADASRPDAVMSTVIVDPAEFVLETARDIQMAYCCNIHFFASVGAAAEWAAGRDDIEILTLDEAFELGLHLWPEAYRYAESLVALGSAESQYSSSPASRPGRTEPGEKGDAIQ